VIDVLLMNNDQRTQLPICQVDSTKYRVRRDACMQSKCMQTLVVTSVCPCYLLECVRHIVVTIQSEEIFPPLYEL
jgi:hypothetical protein